MERARLYQQQKNYPKAIDALQAVARQADNLWADDALFALGDINQNVLNNKAQVMQYYQKIIDAYPGSLLINEARKRYRLLRGDLPTE
jgi:TolA-binding protein